MFSYIVAMKFLSWFFSVMLLLGYGMILQCERELCRKEPRVDEEVIFGMQRIIDEFNGRSWAGRVMWTMYWGATYMSIPFVIINKIYNHFKEKKEKEDE